MRPSWDRYFCNLAETVATRSTCDRAHVGCVLVKDNRIVSTGYNGSLPGLPHCDEVGHELHNGHCVRTIHAEANAIIEAGRDARGATAYCTHYPCHTCAMLLARAGIVRVVYLSEYRLSSLAAGVFEQMKVEVTHHER